VATHVRIADVCRSAVSLATGRGDRSGLNQLVIKVEVVNICPKHCEMFCLLVAHGTGITIWRRMVMTTAEQ
jgi:hypothetical protein